MMPSATTVIRPVPGKKTEISWLPLTKERSLATNEIHIWLVNLDLEIYALSRFLRYLSLAERTRAQHLRFEEDRRRFVLAKGMFRSLLGDYLGIEPHEIHFSIGPSGKPELSERIQNQYGPLHFNQAHSAHLGIYAFSRNLRVGVDIEEVRPFPDLDQISTLLFTDHELENFRQLHDEERKKIFFETWTCKEAFVKALGKGLTLPLNHFEVAPTQGASHQIVQSHERLPQPLSWFVKKIPVSDHFAAAICAEGEEWKLRCSKW